METNSSSFIPDLWAKEQLRLSQMRSDALDLFRYLILSGNSRPTIPLTFWQKIKQRLIGIISGPVVWVDNSVHSLAVRLGIDLDTEYPNYND